MTFVGVSGASLSCLAAHHDVINKIGFCRLRHLPGNTGHARHSARRPEVARRCEGPPPRYIENALRRLDRSLNPKPTIFDLSSERTWVAGRPKMQNRDRMACPPRSRGRRRGKIPSWRTLTALGTAWIPPPPRRSPRAPPLSSRARSARMPGVAWVQPLPQRVRHCWPSRKSFPGSLP